MSDKYGTVLLFYTGIVVLVLLMASGIEHYQQRWNAENRAGQTRTESADEATAETAMQKNKTAPLQNETCQTDAETTAQSENTANDAVQEKIDTQLDRRIPRIALTFDDGPSRYTETLLDGLKDREIKASFFLIGNSIEQREETIERMYREGHLIGNHTYDHVQLTALPEKTACDQVMKTCDKIEEVTGYSTVFVRPPYGLWPKEMEYCVTMIPVLWNIDSLDWTTSDVDGIVNRVVSSARDGGIILMHDCYDSSVQAALRIVDELKEQGYCFVTVDELLCE